MKYSEMDDQEILQRIGNSLGRFEIVKRYDNDDWKENWEIAHSICDILDSAKKIQDELLPRLLKEQLTEQDAADILNEIGEEFRHILYHIGTPKTYEHLQDNEKSF